MGTKFNHCPNCRRTPSGGLFGGVFFKVYECKRCGTHWCFDCGKDRCPDCASKERREVGEVRKRS